MILSFPTNKEKEHLQELAKADIIFKPKKNLSYIFLSDSREFLSPLLKSRQLTFIDAFRLAMMETQSYF